MGENSADFAKKNANELSTPGRADVEELFYGQTKGMLLVHWRDIVQSIEIRKRLKIGLVLDQFLCAPVQKSDMGVRSDHDLPIKLQY